MQALNLFSGIGIIQGLLKPKIKASPKIKINFGSLTAGSSIIYDSISRNTTEFPAGKYAPLNILQVINNSNENITIYLEGKPFPIQSKSSLTIEYEDKINFYNIKIENNGTNTITDNEVIIYVQSIRKAGEDY